MSDAFDATPPAISTPRLRLRALLLEDAPAIHAYAFDPEAARFTPWRPHSSELFAKGLINVITQPQFLNWAVIMPPTDLAIGMVFLHSFSRQHQKAEIAFNLAQAHWNQGLATEAVGAVLHFAFHQLGLNRIEALCMPENLSSRKLLEKLGMTCEGRMRKVHHRYDGFHDMDLFAVLSNPSGPT
ncbi:MAG TPA: GNAT family N-acetyltransferase [Opitutaceae bacterium]|jgi:ribosomal-protein-alanine N-acetyltransferase|nr:GNAT family N-acetyltransferase [Opitutaceae bacterium]